MIRHVPRGLTRRVLHFHFTLPCESFSRREKMRNRPSANQAGCTGEGLYPVCDQTRCEHWQCRGYFTSSCMCSSFFLMERSGLIRRIPQGSRRRLPHLHFTIHSEALLALRIESRVSDGVWLPSSRRRLVRKGGRRASMDRQPIAVAIQRMRRG